MSENNAKYSVEKKNCVAAAAWCNRRMERKQLVGGSIRSFRQFTCTVKSSSPPKSPSPPPPLSPSRTRLSRRSNAARLVAGFLHWGGRTLSLTDTTVGDFFAAAAAAAAAAADGWCCWRGPGIENSPFVNKWWSNEDQTSGGCCCCCCPSLWLCCWGLDSISILVVRSRPHSTWSSSSSSSSTTGCCEIRVDINAGRGWPRTLRLSSQ